MKSRQCLFLALLFGLVWMIGAAAIAQTATQSEQKKNADSCCAMDSCCCNGDSCDNPKQGDNESKACCCSTGDSCPMKDKESMKNHAEHGDCCCCSSDSCDMKMSGNMKDHPAEHHCCCAMKMKQEQTKPKQSAWDRGRPARISLA